MPYGDPFGTQDLLRRIQSGQQETRPGGLFPAIGRGIRDAAEWYDEKTTRGAEEGGRLGREAEAASGFAGGTQEQFGQLGGEATTERDYLRRIARGEESVSAIQLQQALQQNQAAQQSMAAGARPGGAAMAARTAAMTAGRQGAGLAGQQAVAGIQERQQAQQALANMLMQQRQQELQATLGSRGQAIGGFGAQYQGALGQPTGLEKGMQFVGDLGSMVGLGGGSK